MSTPKLITSFFRHFYLFIKFWWIEKFFIYALIVNRCLGILYIFFKINIIYLWLSVWIFLIVFRNKIYDLQFQVWLHSSIIEIIYCEIYFMTNAILYDILIILNVYIYVFVITLFLVLLSNILKIYRIVVFSFFWFCYLVYWFDWQ